MVLVNEFIATTTGPVAVCDQLVDKLVLKFVNVVLPAPVASYAIAITASYLGGSVRPSVSFIYCGVYDYTANDKFYWWSRGESNSHSIHAMDVY